MREDGFIIDKIWLSKTSGVVSEGNTSSGPTASPLMNTQARYVQKTLSSSASAYHARFWFDPNSLTLTNTQTIFEGTSVNGTNSRFKLNLQKTGSVYQLSVQTQGIDSPWQTIADGPHLIDVEYAAASSGYVKLSVDGLPAVMTPLPLPNTAGQNVDEIRLGLLGSINSATRGALYSDGFQSWTTPAVPYRYSRTEYSRYTDPTDKWVIEKVSKQTTWDGTSGALLADQRYRYDNADGTVGALGQLRYTRVVNPQIASQNIDSGYVYDPYGNVIATCAYVTYTTDPNAAPSPACANSPNSAYRLSTVTYDSTYNLYPVSTTNPAGHTTTLTPDPATGLTLTVKDPNGQIDGTVTTTTYDGLGRALTITNPGYAQPNIEYFYPTLVNGTVSAPFAVQLQAWDETASVYRSAWTIYDGLGRGLQVQGPAESSGQRILVDTKYDARSLTLYSGLPRQLADTDSSRVALTNFLNSNVAYYYTPNSNWTNVLHATNTYDALGRVTISTQADGTQQRVFYDGLTTTGVDANNHQKVQVSDVYGRLKTVKEYTGTYPSATEYATTTYTYDSRNLLTDVSDAAGNLTHINYDGFGRKVNMTDPDMGYWQYGYDIFGNLISQIDAKTQTLSFEYDVLNRMTKKWSGAVSTGTLLATYYYDDTTGGNKGIGQRTKLIDPTGTTTWFFARNAQAQPVVTATYTITGAPQAYTSIATSDAFGRPLTQTYPSGEVLNYTYNAMGALETLSGTNTYLTGVDYNESGQVAASYLGNGIVSQNCYQANNLRLTQIRAYSGALQGCGTTPSSPRLNLQYSQYDSIGNVKQIVDSTRSETLNYAYDDLDRLLSVGGTYSQSFAYSGNDGKIGNLTSKAGVTETYTAQSASCPSGALSKPHAVTSAGSDSYCYDANGNMEKRTEGAVTYTQNFDAENSLTSVIPTSGTATSFKYDGDGNLVAKLAGTVITYYIGGVYEVEVTNTTITKKTSYYPAGGAIRVIDGTGDHVYYILKDHLGSASVTLYGDGVNVGTIAAEMRFYPFGETRVTSGAMPTDQQFTGQRNLGSNLGNIYYYGARLYSPKLGRFLSADTIVPEPGNPQALNRYSYVYNNPVNKVDPTGHRTECYNTPYFISETTGDNGISWANCWSWQAMSLVANATWDTDLEKFVSPEDKLKAESAVKHFIADPSFFAELYVQGDAWLDNDEVAALDLFAQYSTLHSTAENLVWLSVAQTFGTEAAGELDATRLHNFEVAITGEGTPKSAERSIIDFLSNVGIGAISLGVHYVPYRGRGGMAPIPDQYETIGDMGDALDWERGNEATIANANALTLNQVQSLGMEPEVVNFWLNEYTEFAGRFPKNPNAAGRLYYLTVCKDLLGC
jgi:RHS repeat-associated protein